MANLKTNYKDRLLNTSVNTERKFNLVDSDGNVIASGVSLRDITQYSQTGDTFGAADINKITAKINEQNNNLNSMHKLIGHTIDLSRKSIPFNTSITVTMDPNTYDGYKVLGVVGYELYGNLSHGTSITGSRINGSGKIQCKIANMRETEITAGSLEGININVLYGRS